jgi:hypothetical protein
MIEAVAAHAARHLLVWSQIVFGGPICPHCFNARREPSCADFVLRSSMSTPQNQPMN